MAGNPFLQNLDPQTPPDPVTPAASPSDPAGYAMVSPHGQGPAPYSIQDPAYTGGGLQAEITAAFDATNAEMGAGFLYPQGPRQAEASVMLDSPQGFGSAGYDIDAGTTAGWPADVEPDVAGP